MSARKLLLISFLIFILCFPSIGDKKRQPLPLSELQNPKGPSYVPIPYPKNREEILVDLEHIIKKFFSPRKGVTLYGKSSVRDDRISDLFEKDSELYIDKIVRVANRTTHRAEEFILIDIHESPGNATIRIGMEDSGLFSKARFGHGRNSIIPLMSLSEVRDHLASKQELCFKNAEIESIEYELYEFCSLTSPFLKIKTSNKTFYMSAKRKLYEIQEIGTFTSLNSFMLSYGRDRDSTHDKKLYTPLVNTINNKIMYLNEVK